MIAVRGSEKRAITGRRRLRREVAFLRLLVATRAFVRAVKFNPDQPRRPAGQTGGGRWTSPRASSGGLSQQTFADLSGSAPWDVFANTLPGDGDLAA